MAAKILLYGVHLGEVAASRLHGALRSQRAYNLREFGSWFRFGRCSQPPTFSFRPSVVFLPDGPGLALHVRDEPVLDLNRRHARAIDTQHLEGACEHPYARIQLRADVAAVADAPKLVVDVDGLALQGALHAAVRHDHDVLAQKALGDVVLLGKPAHGNLGVDALAFLGGNAEGDGLVAPAAACIQ